AALLAAASGALAPALHQHIRAHPRIDDIIQYNGNPPAGADGRPFSPAAHHDSTAVMNNAVIPQQDSTPQPLRCIEDEVLWAPVTAQTPIPSVISLQVTVTEVNCDYAAAGVDDITAPAGCKPAAGRETAVIPTIVSSSSCRGPNKDVVQLFRNQTLGTGTCGRVVVGMYDGQKVAVKLLNRGLASPSADCWTATHHQGDCAKPAPQGPTNGEPDGDGVVNPACAGACPNMAALAQEVEVLARCKHPNIVRLLAASLRSTEVCLVMELMDTSLEKLMYDQYRDKHLPFSMVLHVGIQIARALSYLHPTILHRGLWFVTDAQLRPRHRES
ncbi:hypothetical protein Vretifemale_11043, partial [Volvox reticuliferus]